MIRWNKQIQRIVVPRSAENLTLESDKGHSQGHDMVYHFKGLVTKNTHAKYQSSICNSAKVMAKVKVFATDGQTDEWDLMSPRFRESGGQKKKKYGITSIDGQNEKRIELARIRSWNLLIRSQTRYPLRHKPAVIIHGLNNVYIAEAVVLYRVRYKGVDHRSDGTMK